MSACSNCHKHNCCCPSRKRKRPAPTPPPRDFLTVPNIAALAALPAASLPDLARVLVLTLDQFWELDRSSTAPTDGITIVAANGGGGNWLRIETFSKRWSELYANSDVWIDPLNGDDENVGSSAAAPLKTAAEGSRRLHQAGQGRNYIFRLLNDVPLFEAAPRPFGTVRISDRWRPSWIAEANPEDISSFPTAGGTGVEQTFNFSLLGTLTTLATGLVLGAGGFVATPTAPGGAQATVDLGSPANAALALGQIVRIDTGPSAGAFGTVAEILGGGSGGVVRVTQIAGAGFAGGGTFSVVRGTRWNPPLILSTLPGRLLVQDVEFPAPAGPPQPGSAPPSDPATLGEQAIVTTRYNSITWIRCRWERPMDTSTMNNNAYTNCIFDYRNAPAFLRNGPGGTVVIDWFNLCASAITNSVAIQACVRAVFHAQLIINGFVIQDGFFETITTTPFNSFGFFAVGNGVGKGEIILLGTGMSVFDWPSAAPSAGDPFGSDQGVRLSDYSVMKVGPGADLRGSGVGVGLRVNGSSKFLWETQGATQPSITGTVADLRLERTTLHNQRIRDWAGSAQPNFPRPIPLSTWAEWAAPVALDPGVGPLGTGFGRQVMDYGTGAVVAQVSF